MRAVLAALAMVAGASGTQAATVTFDGMGWLASGEPWVEDGITTTGIGGTLGYHGLPGEAHLDDGGTHFASAITFTMDGRFDAIGFDIGPSSSAAYYCETPATPFGDGDCDPFAPKPRAGRAARSTSFEARMSDPAPAGRKWPIPKMT